MSKTFIKLKIHDLGQIACILNRMQNRIRAFRDNLPEGFIVAEKADIEEIKDIFNDTFKQK